MKRYIKTAFFMMCLFKNYSIYAASDKVEWVKLGEIDKSDPNFKPDENLAKEFSAALMAEVSKLNPLPHFEVPALKLQPGSSDLVCDPDPATLTLEISVTANGDESEEGEEESTAKDVKKKKEKKVVYTNFYFTPKVLDASGREYVSGIEPIKTAFSEDLVISISSKENKDKEAISDGVKKVIAAITSAVSSYRDDKAKNCSTIDQSVLCKKEEAQEAQTDDK